MRAGIDLLQTRDFRCRQAGLRILATFAGQLRRLEVAGQRIGDQAILDPIPGIASGHHGCGNHRDLVHVNPLGGHVAPQLLSMQVHHFRGRRTPNNAVVVVWIAVRLGERLPAAGRAAHKV